MEPEIFQRIREFLKEEGLLKGETKYSTIDEKFHGGSQDDN